MIGIGTVGAGTFRVLARHQAVIAARAGRGIDNDVSEGLVAFHLSIKPQR